jgi:hypothetical protein
MSIEHGPTSHWQGLHERGLNLKDEKIDFVTNHFCLGIQDVYTYLNIDVRDRNLGILFADDVKKIGYVEDLRKANIPFPFLKELEQFVDPINEITITVWTDGLDTFKVWLSTYLRNAGREEAIHHYQTKGHPLLNASLPSIIKYKNATEIGRLLCDLEVEARTITDQIAILNNEAPMWKILNEKLEKRYPDRYNKPLI